MIRKISLALLCLSGRAEGKPTIDILLAAAQIVRSPARERHADHADAHGNHDDGGYQGHHEVQIQPLGHPGGQRNPGMDIAMARAIIEGRDGALISFGFDR